jgi:hypothetical protein
MSEQPADGELREIESALRALAPTPPAISRDRLFYLAGRRSARRGSFWPLMTVAFAALSAVLGQRLAAVPESPPDRVVAIVPTPQSLPLIARSVERPFTVSFFELLFRGAPSFIPAEPGIAREFDDWPSEPGLSISSDEGDVSLPPLEEWLGMTPGSLPRPPRTYRGDQQ